MNNKCYENDVILSEVAFHSSLFVGAEFARIEEKQMVSAVAEEL